MRFAGAAFLAPLPRSTPLCTVSSVQRSLVRATTSSPRPRPKPGVSAAIFRYASDPSPEILLIQRGKPPNQFLWALPGGAQNPDESPMHAILRELEEETAISLNQLNLLPSPVRSLLVADGAWRLQVFAGVCTRHANPVAGDDALDAQFWSMEDLSRLQTVSDLEHIVREAADKVASYLKSA